MGELRHLRALTAYQLLEVDPRAAKEEIRRAFALAQETYGTDSMATYSLLGSDERREIFNRIREAYMLLMDDEKRRGYDDVLLREGRVEPADLRPVPRGSFAPAPAAMVPLPSASVLVAPPLPPPPAAGSIEYRGAVLGRLREERGLTLRDISKRSKVNVTYLRFIEEEAFDLLPAPVYVRGFLRLYAESLGLNGREVVESYMPPFLQSIAQRSLAKSPRRGR